jgi:flagellar basal body-associated protein FliL
MSTEAAPAAPKKKGKGLILLLLMAILAAGSGGALPWVMAAKHHDAHAVEKKKKAEPPVVKNTAILFGDVVVNLSDERVSKYLRVKLMVAIDESDSKEVTELLNKQKPFLKSWLIGHLADLTSQEVNRKIGVNRIRREIRDQFNAMMYPNGEEKIIEILFDEFVVQ